MKIVISFDDGQTFDMSNFKGEFTYQNVEKHYGKEIADKIMEANPYYKMGQTIKENLKKFEPIPGGHL